MSRLPDRTTSTATRVPSGVDLRKQQGARLHIQRFLTSLTIDPVQRLLGIADRTEYRRERTAGGNGEMAKRRRSWPRHHHTFNDWNRRADELKPFGVKRRGHQQSLRCVDEMAGRNVARMAAALDQHATLSCLQGVHPDLRAGSGKQDGITVGENIRPIHTQNLSGPPAPAFRLSPETSQSPSEPPKMILSPTPQDSPSGPDSGMSAQRRGARTTSEWSFFPVLRQKKKAIHFPSGEKNGPCALSAP